ncbi:dihydroorotase [Candidatus Vallotia cooleyia]|uniref:dihydroorotase n=1 Tax=Candidatus Vallotiella adelgis TaxID=1177211 RepID=UPI001D007233|nr:dihydroorotase [Candidatus Vallotia cooleyia]UDG82447.1 Dihydroorotase-like protein [Candidatus Vallotia cooleyia]
MMIHIKGGRVIDPVAGTDQQADIWIADGRILSIGDAVAAPLHDARTFDATGLTIAPGLVDLCARLREPGFEYRATLESEMAAALAGGVTSLVCPPDTDPPLDEPGLVEMLKFRARNLDQVHVYPLGALTVHLRGEVITEMAELTEAGCVGFTQADQPIIDTTVLLRALQYANTFDYTVWLRPQDPYLGRSGIAASGPVASRLGLPGVPVAAETIALHRILELIRATGARVHLQHLSSAAGLALVRAARCEGLPVTCDVTINHVHLIDLDIGYFDAQFRVDPPLRSPCDRDAIRAALADGTIDAICSDHTPVDDDEKLRPFGEASPGATGLELLLSLTLKWALEERQSLAHALSKITYAPARLLRLPVGRIEPGSIADLCVFDLATHWRVEPQALKSQGHNTPFLGHELPVRVRATIVAGRVVYDSRDRIKV